jgi:diguanylate cyclase (GGDEF)-like protein
MKADTISRPLLRTPAGAITIVSILGPIAYLVWLYSGYYSTRSDILLSGIALALLYMLASIYGVYIISHRGFGRALRLAWFLMSLAAWCYVIAHGLRTYYALALEIPPFPSPADFFYLLFYPLTLFGVLVLSSVFVPKGERTILRLDLFIVMAFFGMVLWYYFFASPIFASTRTIPRNLAFIYCLGDVLILSIIISLSQRDLPKAAHKILGFMAAAMVISLIGDSLFAFFELNNLNYVPGFISIIWMSAALAQMMATAYLIAYGPKILNDPPARSRPLAHMFRLALPYLAVIVGLALLAIIINTTFRPDSRMLGVLYGSFALVGLVLVRQYVVSKENVRLYQKMQHIAWTDSLTGLYNRHFFNEMLPREIERANRYGNQLSVLLLDIDGFKKYNDTYGHLKGDTVLRTIGRVFTTQLRVSDTIARFGGDEFVVILPETNRSKAIAIASRIRNAVAQQSFGDVSLSVSIGVASFRVGMTPEQLLDEADQEMYRRKHSTQLELPPLEEIQSVDTTASSLHQDSFFQ